MLNDTCIRIKCREGIKWQTDPGRVFTDEYFDAYDIYFSLYSWAHVSETQHLYKWIEEMKIVDQYTIDIFIDGDHDTLENEPFTSFLPRLSTQMFPEHYLNQTQEADGVTPDILDESWNTFATNYLGTGPFELGSYNEGIDTTLTIFEDCWLTDSSVDKTNMNSDERFGDFSNGVNSLRIRIIPDLYTRLLEFEIGKIDLVELGTFMDKRDAYLANPDYTIQEEVTSAFNFLGYNMREDRDHIGNPNPAPGDESITVGLAVRKAISYAIDRVEINDVVHRGDYSIADHPIYQKMGIWCNPNIIRYNHDL